MVSFYRGLVSGTHKLRASVNYHIKINLLLL